MVGWAVDNQVNLAGGTQEHHAAGRAASMGALSFGSNASSILFFKLTFGE
jgi:hypothetical protein